MNLGTVMDGSIEQCFLFDKSELESTSVKSIYNHAKYFILSAYKTVLHNKAAFKYF